MTTLAPGFIWALGFSYGVLFFSDPAFASISLCLSLIAIYPIGRYIKALSLFFLLGLFTIAFTVHEPIGKETIGIAVFEPKSVESKFQFNKRRYTYSGTLHKMNEAKSLPTKLSLYRRLPCSGVWQLPAQLHWLGSKGLLKPLSPSFSPLGKKENLPIQITSKKSLFERAAKTSLGDLRYALQQKAKKLLGKSPIKKSSKEVLAALFFGQRPSDLTRFYFQRAGLTHLLVVSGFHFALLAGCVMFVLLRAMRPRPAAAGALIVLTLYYLFLGPSPSIQRAFIACALYAGSIAFRSATRPEHALGLAALIELIFNPFSLYDVGFQLSYGLTLSILLLYPAIQPLFLRLKQRSASLHPKLQKTYEVFIDLISLNITVSLVCSLMSIAYFQTFPLISLIYNLIIPPLGSLAMLLAAPTFLALGLPKLFSIIVWPSTVIIEGILTLLKYVPMRLYYELIWIDPPQKGIAFILIVAMNLVISRKIIDPNSPIRVESGLQWRS